MRAARMHAEARVPVIRRGMAGCFAALLWPLLLGACAGDSVHTAAPNKPNTSQRKFEQRPVSGSQVTTAWLSIRRYNFLSTTFYEGELQFLCFKTRPVIRLAFNLRVGSDKTAALACRFDQNPERYAKAKFFAQEKFIVIDDGKEVADFSNQLQSAQSLFLRVTRLRGGSFTAKFPVHGAQHAIDTAFAECPIAHKPKPHTSKILFAGVAWSSPEYSSTTRDAQAGR